MPWTRYDQHYSKKNINIDVCLISADACFKAASLVIKEFPMTLEIDGHVVHTENILVSYIKQMLSILLVVPVLFIWLLYN